MNRTIKAVVLSLVVLASGNEVEAQFVPPGLPDVFEGMTCIASCANNDSITYQHVYSLMSAAGIECADANSAVRGFWVKDDDISSALRVLVSDRELTPYLQLSDVVDGRLPKKLASVFAGTGPAYKTEQFSIRVAEITQDSLATLPAELKLGLTRLELNAVFAEGDRITFVKYRLRHPLVAIDKRAPAFDLVVGVTSRDGVANTKTGRMLVGQKPIWTWLRLPPEEQSHDNFGSIVHGRRPLPASSEREARVERVC